MIDRFLHYVRADYREAPVTASLDEVVRRSVGMYVTDRRVHLDLGADTPRCFAVKCVRHTLLNLVQNALEYGLPPATVTTRLDDGAITLSVTDRGEGLSAAQWREPLRPFQRLYPVPNSGHTGLGLALVERLIRSSGGAWQGRQIDGGFIVEFRLPAV